MDARQGLAAILRDAPLRDAPQDEVDDSPARVAGMAESRYLRTALSIPSRDQRLHSKFRTLPPRVPTPQIRIAADTAAIEPMVRPIKAVAGAAGRKARGGATTMVSSLQAEMLSLIPKLRAFAVSLSRDPDQAGDLIQETLLSACRNIDSFEPGSNMAAWLSTILRNHFYSEYRRRRRDVQDVEGAYTNTLVVQPEQIIRTEYEELWSAFAKLPKNMRDLLFLVGVGGASYPEAARICGCATGTAKSRVHRARRRLAEMLSIEGSADFAGDPGLQAGVARVESQRPRAGYSAQ
jgi:RNA polymerase sigma-70 factor (ECF subfamily)